jgi:hypothetical protein
MNIFSHIAQFADLYGRQTSGDNDNRTRTLFSDFPNALPALGRCYMCYAAGINNGQVGFFGQFDFPEPEIFELLSNLLAFILIYFAAKRIYGKRLHCML